MDTTRREQLIHQDEKFTGQLEIDLNIDGQPRKITADLTEHDLYLDMDKIKLDFWDVDTSTVNTVMHMFTSEDQNVTPAEKLKRMESWAGTIQSYNKIMVSQPGGVYLRKDLVAMLKTGHIPRPLRVILRGGSAGLRRLYESLILDPNPENANEFIVEWEKLLMLAESGEFVGAWKKLKGLN